MIDDGLLRGGIDEKMLADFRAVADCTAQSGESKFLPRPLQRLAEFLVGRSGGPNRDTPLYELCHLVNTIDAVDDSADGRWRFFFQDMVRSSTCRDWFRNVLSAGSWRRDGFEMTENGIAINYADDSFSISFGRMPFLVALFEFLSTMEEMAFHTDFNDILDAMVVAATGKRAVQDASNRIAAALRQYRGQHRDRNWHDEAFTAIQRFLHDRQAETEGGYWSIDDATVLVFWQQHNTGIFRTYRNAFEHFANFYEVVITAASHRAVAAAAPLGPDREIGEVDPDDLSGASAFLSDQAAWQDPLPLLDQKPASGIKFLTKTGERASLAPLMAFGPFAVRLPLAFLRYLSYGAVQAAITTDLQFHPEQPPPDVHVKCVRAENYRDRQELYRQLLEHLGRMQLATYHVLSRSISYSDDGNTVSLDAICGANLFEMARRDLEEEPDVPDAEVAAMEETAAGIFRRISRRGFDEDALADEDRLEGFGIGAGVLYAAANILNRFLDTLQKLDGDGDGLSKFFADDRTIFTGEFVKLYGVTDD
jgi:hypothetical protein